MSRALLDASETSTRPPAAQGAGRRLLTDRFVVLWFVGFLTYSSVYLLLPVLPLYLQQYSATAAVIGGLIGVKSAVALFSRPFAGWFSDGLGRRPLITLGACALLVSTLGLPLATGAVLFGLLRIIAGIGWGSLTANANTLAGELAPEGRRGEAIGYYTMAGSTALALGPVSGLYLVRSYGYATAFLVAAGLTALALILSLCLEKHEPAPLPPFNLGNLISRPALGPAALLMLHAATYGGVVTFLPLLAAQRGLGNPGLFFTVYALNLIVLRGVAGRLSDRFGRPAIIAPGLLCAASAMQALAFSASRWEMLVAAVLFAIGMAFVQPPSLAWALDLAGGRRGTAMATMVAAQDLGIALGSVTLGVVGTLAGYGALFGTAAGLALVATGLLTVVSPRVQRRPAP